MTYEPIGDTALTIRQTPGGPPFYPAALARRLRDAALPGVVDAVAAFDAVTVVYDIAAMRGRNDPIDHLSRLIQGLMTDAAANTSPENSRRIELPVDYGGDHGPDLLWLAKLLKRPLASLIEAHTGTDYTVAAVGFLPGFAYLSGLPTGLRVARRATPRVRVPAGSVAIGGPYTGVYPVASPGGWHLIGRARTALFDPLRPDATPFRVGDRVRFVAVSSTEA
ncbi:MAG TPA: 5-oxoprolinase subunit PxpB [Tepidisphaeraceae bacterium]|jgi:KipI family sensor histidine kinase inhibitor